SWSATGTRTSAGSRPGTRSGARRATGTGRRPSRGPSTGSTSKTERCRAGAAPPPSAQEAPDTTTAIKALQRKRSPVKTTPLGASYRLAALENLAREEFDVLVVGGGVVGAGAALDAVSRGLSVALVEARDWAA